MAAISEQSLGVKIVRGILSFGFAIVLMLLVFTILSLFDAPKNGICLDNSTITWILISCVWCLVCYVLQLRLALGTWILSPSQNPDAPEYSMSRKTRVYFGLTMIFGLVFLAVASRHIAGEDVTS